MQGRPRQRLTMPLPETQRHGASSQHYQLGEPSLTFLRHVVNSRGISIPTERVEAIKRFPVPTFPKELDRFLGICAFFHRFVRHA